MRVVKKRSIFFDNRRDARANINKILLARVAFMEFLRRREPHHPKFACALFLGGRCRKAALQKSLCWLSRRRVEFTDAHNGVGELRLDVDSTTAFALKLGLDVSGAFLGFVEPRFDGGAQSALFLALFALELKRRFGVPCALWPRFWQAGDARLACCTCRSRERRSSGRRLNMRLN